MQKLRDSGWNEESSEQVMRLARNHILEGEQRSRSQGVGKWELENEAYLFAAALSELRTEIQVKSRNDTQNLRTQAALLHRESDGLREKMREDFGALKTEIDYEMGNRKEESNQIGKELDLKIADFTNKHNVSVGDLKTEIEATKWIVIRRSISIIATFVVIVFGGITISGSKQKKPDEKLPTLEELGVRKMVDMEESELSPLVLSERRIGEDEEER
ncbi:hypothetical protein BT69DRAFT_1212214 [Atractiella rhizophila]|nr:hypothetical protein BT69DRAFT_1212214 [Atractiella rhizophila]